MDIRKDRERYFAIGKKLSSRRGLKANKSSSKLHHTKKTPIHKRPPGWIQIGEGRGEAGIL